MDKEMQTSDININNIYNNPSLPPLKNNPNILHKYSQHSLLKFHFTITLVVFTFNDPMGSVLGPIFVNFYMSDFGHKIFSNIKILP